MRSPDTLLLMAQTLEKIRTLVVDDSALYRKIVSESCTAVEDMEVVGTAPNGKIALAKVSSLRPDLVLVDMIMPEMSGVETLRKVMEASPGTSVVVISGQSTADTEDTLEALELGALDFIPKPKGRDMKQSFEQLVVHLGRIVRLVRSRPGVRREPPGLSPPVERRRSEAAVKAPSARSRPLVTKGFGMLVVGVSTGGPNALKAIIPKLPGRLNVPVLLVQHMPAGFTQSLAKSLDRDSALSVKEAEDGESPVANTVYIAPGGRHMVLKPPRGNGIVLGLNDGPPVRSCRPSVDVLFESVAEHYDRGVLSLILTGMGDDGLNGVRRLKARGHYSLAQDEESCVVYGMPRAVAEAGLVDEVLPLGDVASRVRELLKA